MFRLNFPKSNDSVLFYVEQSSNGHSPPKPNTPIVLNSTEMSGNNTRKMITLSSIASPGPQIVTIDSDSKEQTMPFRFGRQLPNIPPIVSDLNLAPNPFDILATKVVANPRAEIHDENYSPQSPEPSEPSPISTPPMNLSTIKGRGSSHDEGWWYILLRWWTQRFFFLPSGSSAATQKAEKKIEPSNFHTKKQGECRNASVTLVDSRTLSRRTHQACRQQTKTSRLRTSYTYIAIFSNICIYIWYVIVSYQTCAHM